MKNIKLDITEPQFKALANIVESAHSMLEEDLTSRKQLLLIKRMFANNGYKNVLNQLK